MFVLNIKTVTTKTIIYKIFKTIFYTCFYMLTRLYNNFIFYFIDLLIINYLHYIQLTNKKPINSKLYIIAYSVNKLLQSIEFY